MNRNEKRKQIREVELAFEKAFDDFENRIDALEKELNAILHDDLGYPMRVLRDRLGQVLSRICIDILWDVEYG